MNMGTNSSTLEMQSAALGYSGSSRRNALSTIEAIRTYHRSAAETSDITDEIGPAMVFESRNPIFSRVLRKCVCADWAYFCASEAFPAFCGTFSAVVMA